MTWALAGDPWSALGIGALVGGSVLGASLGPWLKRRSGAPRKEGGGSLVLGSLSRETEELRNRIVARGGQAFAGVVIEVITSWDNGYGKDARGVLPRSGATMDQLRGVLPGLAMDLDLPHGCTIELIEPEGEGQRVFVLRITTKLMKDVNIPHPGWEEQRSILDGVPIGVRLNGDTVDAPAREESWLVVGKKGSGKTTLLHGVTATVGMCHDALVWHIDLNGGGMTQPWIAPWLSGEVERPPVDWAAPTIDEAIRMTAAAVRIAKDRKTSTRALKRRHNTNLLPVSADMPEIVIMLDEGAEALLAAGKGKVAELAANLDEIQRIARNEAVNPILSVLRGTGDLVPASMSTQTSVGVCMKVKHQREIASVFEEAWEMKLMPQHLTAKGSMFLGIDGDPPFRSQAWNILPAQMEEQGRRISRVRPDLNEAARRAAGEDYETRYERMRKLFVEDAEIVNEEPEATDATSGTWTSGWDAFAGAGPSPAPSGPALVAGDDGIEDAEIVEDTPINDILVGALRVMADAGSDRATREQLAARLTGGDDASLRDRMKKAGCCPIHPLKVDGKPARGWYRSDIEDAMASVAA
ncbi:hypothetical protein Q7689_00540 [Nocardiopsis tropica]|nr:hypothetical protein [Nocardiopsis tropica]